MAKPTKSEPREFDSPFPHEEGQPKSGAALTKDDLSALREKRLEKPKAAPAPAPVKPKLPPPEVKYPIITAADLMKGHSTHMSQMKARRLQILARRHPEVADLLKENADLLKENTSLKATTKHTKETKA